jgi:ABC-type amino acid transport system permease subunit
VPELTYAAKWLSTNKFRIIEAYSIAAPMYLIAGYAIFALFRLLERRFAVRR